MLQGYSWGGTEKRDYLLESSLPKNLSPTGHVTGGNTQTRVELRIKEAPDYMNIGLFGFFRTYISFLSIVCTLVLFNWALWGRDVGFAYVFLFFDVFPIYFLYISLIVALWQNP